MTKIINEHIENIPLLIKFHGTKHEYANNFIEKGELYMQSAWAYIELERNTGKSGQGDKREGIVFDCCFLGCDHPVYCMYGVYSNQLIENGIIINKQAVSNFCQDEGYISVTNTKKFINRFDACCAEDYTYNMIQYGRKTRELEIKLLTEYPSKALYYKAYNFRHQQEFRIVMSRYVDKIKLQYKETPNIPKKLIAMGEHIVKNDTFTIEIGDISSFSRQYELKELSTYDLEYSLLPIDNKIFSV